VDFRQILEEQARIDDMHRSGTVHDPWAGLDFLASTLARSCRNKGSLSATETWLRSNRLSGEARVGCSLLATYGSNVQWLEGRIAAVFRRSVAVDIFSA